VQEVLDPDDQARRCDLLLALGEAQMPLGDPRRVADIIAPDAIALCRAIGDDARAARTCLMALEALHRVATGTSVGTPEFRDWAEQAIHYAAPGSVYRAHAQIALGRVRIAAQQRAEGLALLRGSLALARELDDPDLLFTAAWQCIWNLLSPQYWRDAVALAEEFIERPRDRVSARTQGQLLEFCGVAFLANGDRDRGERAWRELSHIAGRTRDASNQLQALSFEGYLAVLDGRLDEAVHNGEEIIRQAETLGMPGFAGIWIRSGARALIYTGGLKEQHTLSGAARTRSLLLAHLGQRDAAADLLVETLRSIHSIYTEQGTIDPLSASMDLELILETATVLEERPLAGLIAPLLADCPGACAPGIPASVQRLVGAAYRLLGEPSRARVHYQQAIEACVKMRFRPELALSRLELAELLLEHYPDERPEAIGHLDLAIGEFREMKMQPYLERALKHKGLLTA